MIETIKLNINNQHQLKNAIELFWSTAVNQPKMYGFLNDSMVHSYVAKDENQIIGFAFGYALESFSSNPKFMLYSIDVLEKHQKQGVGKQIIKYLIEDCRSLGFSEVFVLTTHDNLAAMKLYESCGGKRSHLEDVMFEWNL